MVKISVLYPHKDGSGFNMNYYLNNHIPMVRQKLGAACKGVAVEQGLAGGVPAGAYVNPFVGRWRGWRHPPRRRAEHLGPRPIRH
jgi:uncharacterized protein (TIGR02118 family)